MATQRHRAAERHAFLRDGVFVYLDVLIAEVGAATCALHLEHAAARLNPARAPFATIAVHCSVLVDKVRGDVELLGNAVLTNTDLGAVRKAFTVVVAEAAPAPDADAHRRVLAAREPPVDFAGTLEVQHRSDFTGAAAKMAS